MQPDQSSLVHHQQQYNKAEKLVDQATEARLNLETVCRVIGPLLTPPQLARLAYLFSSISAYKLDVISNGGTCK